nr:TRAP transporter small permease subunit [Hydrogenophaga sp.]
MPFLLQISRLIDGINRAIGVLAMWMILAATLISAGNAIIRKVFGTSSNAWLEMQWYLFAAVFMLGGGYAFLRNAHVRIDFISNKFSARTRNWIDVAGIIVFLLPLCYMMITLGWPLFERAWVSGEVSTNAGGLIR